MNKIEALQKARLAKGPLPPVEAGLIRMRKALLWVYRWGWSSSKIIELVGGSARSGLAARLVRTGFLKSTKTISGGYGGGPAALLTLTQKGVDEVEKWIEDPADLLNYELSPHKIDQSKIRHSELAQRSTAKNLLYGLISDYITEQMAAAKSEKNTKQHDIIWIMPDGSRQGIEVELSAKWQRKLDQFILSCIISIQRKNVGKIFIVTDSKAIQRRYQAAFEVGKHFGQWESPERGFAKKIGTYEVPDFVEGKVLCVLID